MHEETITISRTEYDFLNESVTKLDVIREVLLTVGEYGHVSNEFIKVLKTIAGAIE